MRPARSAAVKDGAAHCWARLWGGGRQLQLGGSCEQKKKGSVDGQRQEPGQGVAARPFIGATARA